MWVVVAGLIEFMLSKVGLRWVLVEWWVVCWLDKEVLGGLYHVASISFLISLIRLNEPDSLNIPSTFKKSSSMYDNNCLKNSGTL